MKSFKFKMCLFGDGGVGKTTLINRYISGRYREDFQMTIGVDFYTKHIRIDDSLIVLQIWDFAGENQFKNLLPNYVIGASGGIFMYDISRFSSLMHLEDWLNVIAKASDYQKQYLPILLVGGKCDLEKIGKRVIEKEYAQEYGKKFNLFNLIECSSKTGENVENVFLTIGQKMLDISTQ